MVVMEYSGADRYLSTSHQEGIWNSRDIGTNLELASARSGPLPREEHEALVPDLHHTS